MGLFANTDIAKGQMCLAPFTKSVTALAQGVGGEFVVKVVGPMVGSAHVEHKRFSLQPTAPRDDICTGFFVAQATREQKLANVKIQEHAMVFFAPMPKPTRNAPLSLEGKESRAWIPCFVNHVPIKKDGQVLVCKPKDTSTKPGTEKKTLSFDVTQSSKRQKV